MTSGSGQTEKTQIRVFAYFEFDHFPKSKTNSKNWFEMRMSILLFVGKFCGHFLLTLFVEAFCGHFLLTLFLDVYSGFFVVDTFLDTLRGHFLVTIKFSAMSCTTNKCMVVIPWAVRAVTVGKAHPFLIAHYTGLKV